VKVSEAGRSNKWKRLAAEPVRSAGEEAPTAAEAARPEQTRVS
jgi:hypothetical protein